MALVKCPECGNEVSNRVPACIYCGCPLSEAALAKSAPKVTTLTPNSGEGSPKNHWQRKKKSNKPILILSILTVVLLVIGINVFSSLKCEHEWSDATCSFPKSCIRCGETEGNALSHQWVEATCTSAKHCSLCDISEGVPSEHIWNEASCAAPKTCTVCQETEGTALAHKAGEWEIDEDSRSVISATVWIRRYCENCNAVVDSNLKSFALHEDNVFLFTPEEFAERLERIYDIIGKQKYKTTLAAVDGSMGCGIQSDKVVAVMMFMSKDGLLTESDTESRNVGGIYTSFYTDDIDEVVNVLIGAIIACDSTLDSSTASEIGKQMILATTRGEPYYHNGIGYAFGDDGDGYKLMISVMET